MMNVNTEGGLNSLKIATWKNPCVHTLAQTHIL